MTNDLTNTSPQYLPGDSFIGFEKYLEQYGLPTENVIASESGSNDKNISKNYSLRS